MTGRWRWLLAGLLVVASGAGLLLGGSPGNAIEAMADGRYALAARYLRVDAQAGEPRAQNSLANLLYLGLSGTADPHQAAQLYFAAAQNGYAPAQMNLGHLYSQGLGVVRDPLRAFGWYNMAEIHNSAAAENYLYQISVEYTLSPLQQSTAAARWRTLDSLVAEGL